MEHSADITSQLIALRGGESAAMERLFPLVYDELHRIAHRQMGRERGDHTLDTTGLVHEAYLKLVDQTRAQWSDRAHFFAVASNAMRRILVDYARRYHTDKRGAAPRRFTADPVRRSPDPDFERRLRRSSHFRHARVTR